MAFGKPKIGGTDVKCLAGLQIHFFEKPPLPRTQKSAPHHWRCGAQHKQRLFGDGGLQGLGAVGVLPLDAQILTAHVAVGGQLAVDGLAQVKLTDDGGRGQVKDLLNSLLDLLIGHLAGAEGIDHDGDRLSHTDGIGQLDLALGGKTGGNHILSDPAGGIGGRAVDLAGVLAAEGTAAVAGIAAVGIHDDLTAGQAGVTLRAANDKAAGGVDVVLGILVQQFCRDNLLDHLTANVRMQLHADIRREVIEKVIPAELLDENTKYYINPTGRFVVGGPQGDSGLTGRKIIVDTYGGYARHGGGAFSGKDPSKVDRSAAYAARWVAKNVVAAGLATKCEVELAYAIGVAKPVSIMVDTFGTGKVADEKIEQAVEKVFDLTPAAIIRELDLRKPIYRQLAAYGHMGREDLGVKWENTDRAEALKAAVAE